ncbi:TIGR00730 family Rossman fold protein, partial [Rhodanobacter denitrificans]|nr:TIGR00730 family Rossman fold protein [Rhodanobacter denitrificans]
MTQPTAICVYCGSSSGRHPEYAEQARAFGTEMARRGIALVYGGGKVG